MASSSAIGFGKKRLATFVVERPPPPDIQAAVAMQNPAEPNVIERLEQALH
jgi:hypothetical protein